MKKRSYLYGFQMGCRKLDISENYTTLKVVHRAETPVQKQEQAFFFSPEKTCAGEYCYGFQGQETDDEVKGKGNSNTAMFWQYDTRLARRWNQDPKPNPSISNYACFANSPLFYSDLLGDTLKQDLIGYSVKELEIFQEQIDYMRKTDSKFNYMYESLDQSEEVFTMVKLPSDKSNNGSYYYENNMIAIRATEDEYEIDNYGSAITEEFFHAIQDLNYGENYVTLRETGFIETEAKLFKATTNAGLSAQDFSGKTSVGRFYKYLESPDVSSLNKTFGFGAVMTLESFADTFDSVQDQVIRIYNKSFEDRGLERRLTPLPFNEFSTLDLVPMSLQINLFH